MKAKPKKKTVLLTDKSLTDETVRLPLPKGKTDHFWWDDLVPGFGLRARGDRRSWLLQYKLPSGDQGRMTLGRATAMDATTARSKAEELYEQVAAGRNVAKEKKAAKRDAEQKRVRESNTLAKLVETYLEHKRKGDEAIRPRSYAEVARHLNVYAAPLHTMPVTSIDKVMVRDLLDQIARKSGTVTSNRARASMSAMFSWALTDTDMVTINPVIGTRRREEKSRDRVLSDAELRVIWQSLGDDHYSKILRLLALTGARANEIAALHWSEVDFGDGLIVLPGERTKNGRVHELPMSKPVRQILEKHDRIEGRDLVFGYGAGPFSGWSKSKIALDKAIGDKIGMPWTPHDLRRTVASGMAKLGVSLPVIEKTLNHVSGSFAGIVGVYQRHEFAKEKAGALSDWANHVIAVTAGKNVMPMRKQR